MSDTEQQPGADTKGAVNLRRDKRLTSRDVGSRSRRPARQAAIVLMAAVAWNPTVSRPPESIAAGSTGRAQENRDDRQALHATARELLQRGESQRAAATFAELLDRDPADPRALEGRVRSLLAHDDWPRALSEARGFAGSHPGRPRAVAALGAALLRAGMIADADAVLTPLAEPDDAPALGLLTLSRLRAAQGRVREAVVLMKRALTAEPDDREVLFWASGVVYSRARSIELLERYLERSEGDDPDRIEGARSLLALWRALGKRPIWVERQRPDRLELPLRPLLLGPGLMLGHAIDAAVGERGRRVRLLFDTGSTGLFVVRRLARKRGFVAISDGTHFGGGGKGRHPTTRGLFPSFDLGGLQFGDALLSVTRGELDPFGKFQGLIGISVFDGYEVTLDLERNRLILRTAQDQAEPAGRPYWVVGGQMLVEATANGRRGLFLFDTGATSTMLSLRFARSLEGASLGRPSDVRAFGGRRVGAREVSGVKIDFQGLRAAATQLTAADLSLRSRLGGVEISGFLGRDLLDGQRFVIDTVHRRIRLESAP